MEYHDDDGDERQDNPLFQVWNNLKVKLNLIYDEDPIVNIAFLSKCYDDVFNYLMHVSREQIDRRNAGHQEFHPGKSQEISRDLYLVLISYIDDKAAEFAEVSDRNLI
jgi:hypothetical protein